MSILIATLCINEMEWLPKLYEQHRCWPGLTNWVFVEAADSHYALANPEMVTSEGLSVDGTSEYLARLAARDSSVIYIPHGFSTHRDPAQGKCVARQRYLNVANATKPEYILTLDADEFYLRADQQAILDLMNYKGKGARGFTFRYRNIWRPSSIADRPLFQLEVVGKFWEILVCKFWRWKPSMSYSGNHNSPAINGILSNRSLRRFDRVPGTPEFIHMGFTSQPETRVAKNRYYVERGEGRTDHRGGYVKSRAAFENWKPGETLPNNDKIIIYRGPIPEVFYD